MITKGYHLERQAELSLLDVLAREAYRLPEDGSPMLEGMAAKGEMWHALQSSRLVAEGIPLDTGERRAIRDSEWVDLDHFEHAGWPADAIGINSEERERYRSVRVRSGDVTRLWIDPQLRNIVDPPKPELPCIKSARGGGFMPLFCAAQWIATKGGAETFDPLDLTRWKIAYGELLARLASEDIRVVHQANGVRELIGVVNFVACLIDYPFQDLNLDLHCGSELYLRSYPYSTDEEWDRGKDDSLRIGHKPRWTNLMVEKATVAKYWPFAMTATDDNCSEIMKTGAAGRPSVMHILRNEMAERSRTGKIETSLAEQVRVLLQWFTGQYPKQPCPAQSTTANGLRAQYRSARNPRN